MALAPHRQALRQHLRACATPGGRLAAALIAVNLGNVVFHLVATRELGPEGYGELGSLLSLLAALNVPAGALQTALAGQVVRRTEAGDTVTPWPLVRRGVRCGVAAALLTALCAPLLARFLHLHGTLAVLFLAAYLVPACAAVVPWGYLSGSGLLGRVALAVALSAVTRVCAGTVLLATGGGPAAAIVATVLSDLTLMTVLLHGTARHAPHGGARPTVPLRIGLRGALRGTAAMAGLWTLLGVDVIAARHYLSQADAGRYAALAFAAKTVVFAAQIAAVVLVRRFASADRAVARRALATALAVAAAVGLIATAGLTAGGGLLPLLLGPGYGEDPLLGACLGTAVTLVALLGVLVQFRVARSAAGGAAGWLGVVAFAVYTAVARPSHPAGIALGLALGACTALIAQTAVPVRAEPVQGPGEGAGLLAEPATVDFTLVVPFHNPGPGVADVIARAAAALTDAGVGHEIVAVSDGSTDGSAALLAELTVPGLRLTALPVNRGKGAAVRHGFRRARGRLVGFVDADGDLAPELLPGMIDAARGFDLDAVVGSKHHPCSRLPQPPGPGRLAASHGFRGVTRVLFRLPVRDTQTGIKVFRREALADVLPLCREDRYVIDLELLALMTARGHRRVMEAPVVFRRGAVSTVDVAAAGRMLADVVRLRGRLTRERALPQRGRVEPAPFTPVPVPEPGRPGDGLAGLVNAVGLPGLPGLTTLGRVR